MPHHLKDLYERSIANLTSDEQQQKVFNLLVKNSDVFSKDGMDMGKTDLVKHHIPTTSEVPIKSRPYRAPHWKKSEIDRQIQSFVDKGLLEESDSAWSSPCLLVNKKDGSYRVVCDYRKLNAITLCNAQPIPRIQDNLESLGGAKLFSCLDLNQGFYQVELDKNSREKSAIVTPSGRLLQWTAMPMGLSGSPGTFEKLVEKVFQGLQWEILLLYIDDIIVFGSTFEEELDRLEMVFDRLRKAGLKLKAKKCILFAAEVEFLGHTISENGVSTDTKKIECIKNWPVPCNVSEVHSFFGLASYYRRFIRDFASIAKPLTELTRKHAVFVWTPECQAAFAELKGRLISAPVLSFPSEHGQFILDTDASGTGIGAILSQESDEVEHPVSYASRVLSKPERNYCVTRRELLAVVNYVKYFKHYLLGRKFTIRTDHASLT